jgi:hypothetical protein
MIYSVKHFWCGEAEPTEYFVSSDKKPSRDDVIKVLEIDYAPSHDEITIHSLEVVDLEKALEGDLK